VHSRNEHVAVHLIFFGHHRCRPNSLAFSSMGETGPETFSGGSNGDYSLGMTCSSEEADTILMPEEQFSLPFSSTNNSLAYRPCQNSRPRRPSRKGLTNPPKAFNCFLNAVIQSLWHLDHFRSIFVSLDKHCWNSRGSTKNGHECDEIMGTYSNGIDFPLQNEKADMEKPLVISHQTRCRGVVALEQKTMPTCVYCALRWIFERFQYDDDAHNLPSDGMRVALAALGERNKRFQLKSMEDAAECFEMIMEQIHEDVCGTHTCESKNSSLDRFSCQQANCPAHVVFGYEIFDERYCKCHVPRSTGTIHSGCIYYLSTSKLVSKSREENVDIHGSPSRFGESFFMSSHSGELMMKKQPSFLDLLRRPWKKSGSSNISINRQCPEKLSTNLTVLKRADTFERIVKSQHIQSTELLFGCEMHCRKVAGVRRILIRPPRVFVMSLAWDSLDRDYENTDTVWRLLSPILDLRHIFEVVSSEGNEMYLQSIICFYGLHYVSYCFSTSSSTWLLFDDDKVSEIGGDFQDLVEHCVKRKERPYLLFYSSFIASSQRGFMKPLSHEDWEVLERQQRLRLVLSRELHGFDRDMSFDSGYLSTPEETSSSLKLSLSPSFPALIDPRLDFSSPNV
jgi:hypothetical protein